MVAAKLLVRFVMLVALAAPGLVLAAPDAPKSKDHPLLTRYPNSHIAEYERNYNAVEFAVGAASGVGLAATRPPTASPSTNAPGGSDRAASARPAQLPASAGGGPLNLTIAISGAVFSDDGITEAVSRGVRRGVATGRLPTSILREN